MNPSASDDRRVGPGVAAGVTEAMIQGLVHAFYAEVRRDPALGPIFERVIGDGWDDHLARLCDFWSSVLLMTGRFKGQPMVAHARLDDIGPAHFVRWLELFGQCARTRCPPEAAAIFVARAQVIAESLQMGIALHRGVAAPTSATPGAPPVPRLGLNPSSAEEA